MEATAEGIRIGVVAIVLALTAASAVATHLGEARKVEPPDQHAVQQEPEKRQNFRARRADEFPPWEGFEDCPMAFPCVGLVAPQRWRH